jgi:tetratricopeptide (TPR) repeat protein
MVAKLSPAELLKHTQVPDFPCVHLLGEFESRVTVYSQQIRALNLVYSLFEQGRIEPGDKVAVIGGGVAGLMATAALARRGCQVTLLEKQASLLHLQANCDKRWIHPHIYDWPEERSLREDTDDLPFLRWRAARAREVVQTLLKGWDELRASISTALRIELSVSNVSFVPGSNTKSQELSWNPKMGRGGFQAVIVAVGFGLERTLSSLPDRSYWRDDDLDQPDTGTARSILVSGYGDGGLTDLLRACIRNFRHHELVRDFRLDPGHHADARRLADRLLAIEQEANRQATADDAAKYLTESYRGLDDVAGFVDEELGKRRTNRRVVLNGPAHDPWTRQSSVLNRFLASRLLLCEYANLMPGKLPADGVSRDGSAWSVKFENGTSAVFDEVIVRHGAKPALAEDFNDLWKKSEPLRHRNALDQTREPIWPPGWFDALGSSSPPPDSGGTMPAGAAGSLPSAARASLGTPSSYDLNNRPFTVPFRPKNEALVGRADVLTGLRQQLTKPKAGVRAAAALTGIGGLGKTQLAVEYAHRYRDEYPGGVIWLTADQDLDSQLTQLCDAARWLPPQSEHVTKRDVALHRLRTHAGCLIIFENLVDQAAIDPYIPEISAGAHLLATSRTEQAGFPPVAIDLLDQNDSVLLLLQESGRSLDTDDDQRAAAAIAERLGGLPLALELAGAWLRYRRSAAWRDYLQLLERSLAGAMPKALSSATAHGADLFATLRITEDVFAAEPRLRDILDVLTWSGATSMSRSLLAALLGEPDPIALVNSLTLGQELRILTCEQDASGTASGVRYRVHRLVREVRRQEVPLERLGDGPALADRLAAWLEERRLPFGQLAVFEVEFEHLREWQAHAEKHSWGSYPRLLWLQAYPPFHRGRYRESKDLVERALADSASNELLRAHILNDLGVLRRLLGEEALLVTEEALKIRERLLPANHPDIALSLSNLADIYSGSAQYREALETEKKAWKLREDANPDSADTATSLDQLGGRYYDLGKYDTALSLQQNALTRRQTLHSDPSLLVADSLRSISHTSRKQGHFDTAIEYAKRAAEIVQQILGEDHPTTAVALETLAAAYQARGDQRRGDIDACIPLHHKAIDIRLRFLGDAHQLTVSSRSNLASANETATRGHQGTATDLVRSESLRSKMDAFEQLRASLGEKHPNVAAAMQKIGSSYFLAGNWKEALSWVKQAYDIECEVLGDLHPETIATAMHVIETHRRLGQLHQVRALIAKHLRKLPRDHPCRPELKELQRTTVPPGYRSPGKGSKGTSNK